MFFAEDKSRKRIVTWAVGLAYPLVLLKGFLLGHWLASRRNRLREE